MDERRYDSHDLDIATKLGRIVEGIEALKVGQDRQWAKLEEHSGLWKQIDSQVQTNTKNVNYLMSIIPNGNRFGRAVAKVAPWGAAGGGVGLVVWTAVEIIKALTGG